MRVLITGATGFIGSRLAETCRHRGGHVCAFGQTNTTAEADNAKRLGSCGCDLVLGSVLDPRQLQDAAAGCHVIFHLAAAQHNMGKPDHHFHQVNVTGTKNVLEAGKRAGVRRFVHGSTIGVYGAKPGRAVGEDSPTCPDNIYGVTKLEAEQLVRSYGAHLPVVIIRISETYGPGDRRLVKLFKGLRAGRYFHIGRGQNLHHPVYVDDLVEGLLLAADEDRAVGQTLVIPGHEALTTRQMVEAIAEAVGAKSPRLTVPMRPLWAVAVILETMLRPLGIRPPLHRRRMHFFVKSFKFDGQRSRQVLGYEPKVPFLEGATRTAAWYQHAGLL